MSGRNPTGNGRLETFGEKKVPAVTCWKRTGRLKCPVWGRGTDAILLASEGEAKTRSWLTDQRWVYDKFLNPLALRGYNIE